MIPDVVRQFRTDIVRPAIKYLGLWSEAAENLLVGTALVESDLTAMWQAGGGPAIGLFQVEPATHADVVERLRDRRPALSARLDSMASPWPPDRAKQLVNPFYGCGVARCKYWLDPRPLPPAWDVDALAEYWLKIYNAGGKGTTAAFADRYRAMCA